MADENKEDRHNRELIELLNELRVALPGVQVLFAFLLVLPFQQRWAIVNEVEKAAYFIENSIPAAWPDRTKPWGLPHGFFVSSLRSRAGARD